MRKRRVLYILLTAAFSIALMFPVSTALAYDFEGSTYNDNDFYKLQAFLDTMSDDGVHTNGTRLNPAYESNKPTTWGSGAAILWSSGTSDKRITQLLLGISGLKGSLDLSGFTSLTYVTIRDNLITDVNLSGDTAMTYLDVRRTPITELDASGLTALGWLTCNECPNLTDVNVSGCTALENLFASGSAADSTDIGKLDTLDLSGCTALETLFIDKNLLTDVDLEGLSSLKDLNTESNRLTALDVSECTSLESLRVMNNDIGALDVSTLTSLKTLDCEGNVHLTSLAIKGALNLESVNCTGCALTELDASGLTNLTNLTCGVNDIETLNLSGDTALEFLDCNTNQIESLDVTGFPELYFINCSQNNITAIEGIKTASSLGMLACMNNEIETLDLSGLTGLLYLICESNELTSLNVAGDTSLMMVSCADNRLTTLDLSEATGIMMAVATDNRLSSIKATILTQPVNLTAEGGGYVELYAYDEFYANAIPCASEAFLGWTDASDTEVSAAVRYDLTAGIAYDLTANFTALKLDSSASGGSIFEGGRITLTPSIEGGKWEFDSEYLSRDGNKFTGLKTGTTSVQYTWEDETVTYEVTIQASALPPTGQDSTFVYIAAIGAALALVLAAAGTIIRKRARASQR